MIELGPFALLRPLWLLVPLALPLLLRLTRPRDSLGDWRKAIDAPLFEALLRRQVGVAGSDNNAPLYLSVALLAVALSGPAVKTADAAQFRNLDATLIVLDVSREDGLAQSVAAAQTVLAASGARQTGLIVYAGDAYLASPMTDDVAALEALLFAVDAKTVPDGGVKPARALAFTRRVLREARAAKADIVLITDGEGVDAKTNAEAAALVAEGHALHTLFLASHDTGAAASLRRRTMATLAANGGGQAGEVARAETVASVIAERRVERVTRGALRSLEWEDWGRWLLLLAAAPLLFFMRARTS